jgi:hypothetical protein
MMMNNDERCARKQDEMDDWKQDAISRNGSIKRVSVVRRRGMSHSLGD